ncbi:MAG: SGNH/GDSL hydrolase family protein, partial [Oligoflexales bacterium]|nr:SGNH/GDSL hydrolase family protein [Oligoflexales bacterium]
IDVVSLVTSADREAFKLPVVHKVFMCSDLYKIIQFGTLQGLTPGAAPDVVEKGRQRLEIMRNILRDETQRIADGRGPYADFKGRILLVEDLKPADDQWRSYLAADCVHPNVKGQQLFGEIIWKAMKEAGIL